MAEFRYTYSNLSERASQIILAEGAGLRMLHDDFDDPNWKHGDPIAGTMTFTDVPTPSPPPDPWRAEYQAATTTTAKLSVLARRLGLED